MIRPFQFGDIFLIQRLGRQATKLNTVQSLVQPQSMLWASLTTLIPWNNRKLTTYIMRRRDHELIGAGLLMAQKRPGRPEVDIIALAPALDTAHGHPVIWEKLLAAYIQEATQQRINRIYVDVPDQPLLVSTFSHVGFKLYARQTVWRLPAHGVDSLTRDTGERETAIRRRESGDEWGLLRLYSRTIPAAVQVAEGIQTEKGLKPPILDGGYHGESRQYVLVEQGEIAGALHIIRGPRGYWLQLWADMLRPDGTIPHRLVHFALDVIRRAPGVRLPVYVGVNDYHGGLGSVLAEFGFVPFTDRARMVRQVVQWVREFAPAAAALEPVPAGVVTPFTVSRSHFRLRFPFRLLSRLFFQRASRKVHQATKNRQAKEVEYACGNHRAADIAANPVTDHVTVHVADHVADKIANHHSANHPCTENPGLSVSGKRTNSELGLSTTLFGYHVGRAMARAKLAGRRRARPVERSNRTHRAATAGA